MTKRLIASKDLIVVGAAGMCEARCRRCFAPNLASLGVPSQKKKAELAATAGSKFGLDYWCMACRATLFNS